MSSCGLGANGCSWRQQVTESNVIRAALPEVFNAVDAFDPFAGDRARGIEEGRMLVAEVGGELVGYVS